MSEAGGEACQSSSRAGGKPVKQTRNHIVLRLLDKATPLSEVISSSIVLLGLESTDVSSQCELKSQVKKIVT